GLLRAWKKGDTSIARPSTARGTGQAPGRLRLRLKRSKDFICCTQNLSKHSDKRRENSVERLFRPGSLGGNMANSRCCVPEIPALVRCLRNNYTFAAMDFGRRLGASDEHIPKWICKGASNNAS